MKYSTESSQFQVSNFRNTKDTQGTQGTIEAVVNRIRTDTDLKAKTEKARQLAQKHKEAYRGFKSAALPAITPAGVFSYRNAESLTKHSSLVVLDFDELPPEALEAKRRILEPLPFVAVVFVSPSGTGIKAFCHVAKTPTDAREHTEAWEQLRAFVEPIGLKADPSGSDVSRLCFLAYDPNVFYNPNSTPFALRSETSAHGAGGSPPPKPRKNWHK